MSLRQGGKPSDVHGTQYALLLGEALNGYAMVKPEHTPIRTCVACRSTDAKRGLMRVVRLADGSVCYDPKGKMSGRGAYVCARSECVQLARKQKKLERSLKVGTVPDLVAGLEAEIGEQAQQRENQLASSAVASLRLEQDSMQEASVGISVGLPAVQTPPARDRVEESGSEPRESEE